MSAPEIIRDVEQGSLEWLSLHLGVPTASGFGEFMTNDFEPRKGKTTRTYLYKKLAEKIIGTPLPTYSSRAMETGVLLEPEAIAWFEMQHSVDVERVGFILGADGRCGCSPDGLVGEDAGLECKSPNPETHVRYLDEGVLPDAYVCQVHGSLYVSGRKRWHFLSYCRGIPAFHMVIERDEEKMRKIGECLTKFYADFDATLAKLEKEIQP